MPILIAYRSGSVVASVESDSIPVLTTPSVSGLVAIDRIVLVAKGGTSQGGARYVLDLSPGSGTPAELEIETAPGPPKPIVKSVRFRGFVRCFIAGRFSGGVAVGVRLVPDGAWLKFDSFAIDGLTTPAPAQIGDLATVRAQLAAEFRAPLFEAIGLFPQGGPVLVGWVPAPRPTPTATPTSDPDPNTFALRFTRDATLERCDQCLAVGPVTIALPREIVADAGLDGTPSDPTPLRLVQTSAVLADATGSRLSPEAGLCIVSIRGVPAAPVLVAWNAAAADYVASLQTIQDGRPISWLPRFELPPRAARPPCDPVCCPDRDPATLPRVREADQRWVVTLNVAATEPQRCQECQPADLAIGFRAAATSPFIAGGFDTDAVFPSVVRHDNIAALVPLRARLRLLTVVELADTEGTTQSRIESARHGFAFRAVPLDLTSTAANRLKVKRRQPQRVRIGALDLDFSPPFSTIPTALPVSPDPDRPYEDEYTPDPWPGANLDRLSLFRLTFRHTRVIPHEDIPTTDAHLVLRVERLTPGGQDGLPDEPFLPPADETDRNDPETALARQFTREPSVIIPVGLPTDTGTFTLDARELTRASASQSLSVRLFERGAGGQPVDRGSADRLHLVVLDRNPFLVARVHAPPFRGLAGADGNREVGNWSAAGFEGASWELAGATDGFTLMFPPQTIGEGTEKRRDDDVVEAEAAGFRLGPPAQFALLNSFFRQNFTEAAWNLRRILGYPGQRAPGAGISRLAFELLYGLACRVRSPGLRLAELAARLGALPGPLPDSVSRPFGREKEPMPELDFAFQLQRIRWGKGYAAYLSRLGVFEPWTEAQTGTLTLKEGVGYTLRSPEGLTRTPYASNPADPRLPGGALWGLEFQAQYDPLLNKPESTSGELARPAFSALGGWGFQKAVFRKGITTIYSDTAMGRVFFYSVEQRGRIAGFWNYAKHVVIYERSVAPSRQFQSEQDHLAGRPVLRKVREFVELLQPTRTYPDFDAAPVSRGFVLGIEFKSKVIPVTSAWGRDVPDRDPNGNPIVRGYVIPLWQVGADPAVYPKPQVVARAAGGASPGDEIRLEIDEPQKLLFYSDALAEDASTDLWPAVRDVDFPDLDWPAPEPLTADPAGDLDAPVPDELPTAPGYDPFTYAVVPTRATDVVATRTKQPLAAILRNVSMVRSGLARPTDPLATTATTARSELSAALGQLDQALSSLPAGADAAAIVAQVKGAVKQAQNKVSGGITAVNQVFQGGAGLLKQPRAWLELATGTVKRWKDNAKAFLEDEIRRNIPDQIRVLTNKTPAEVRAVLESLLKERLELFKLRVPPLDPGAGELIGLLNRVLAVPDRVGAVLTSEAEALRAEFARIVARPPFADAVRQAADDARRRLAAVAAQVIGQVIDPATRYFEDLSTKVRTARAVVEGKVAERVAALRAAADGNAAEVMTRVAELMQLVNEAKAALTAAVDNATDIRAKLDTVAKKLLALPVGGTTVEKVVGELGKRLLAKIPAGLGAVELANKLVQAVDDEKKSIESLMSGLASGADLKNLAENGLAKVNGLLKEVIPDNVKQFFTDAAGWEKRVNDLLDLKLPVDALRGQLAGLLGEARGQLDDLAARLAGPLAAKFPAGLTQTAGNTLRLIRAFGDAPKVLGMGFTRDRIGYFFDPIKSALGNVPVDITPVNALVNRAGDYLKASGIRLPTGQLLDQVLPGPDELMKQFDIGKLLPDFAGLKLDKLLPDLKAPEGLKDKVKVTHQFDKQAMRGWVQADVLISEPGPNTLFDAGPIAVSVRAITFAATMRIEAGLTGSPRRTQSGKLSADWDLTFGGEQLITFGDTSLTFDDSGKTKFNLDPSKIRMNGVLKMLSDAVQKLSDPDSGLTIKLKEEGGLPVGVEAILELPLPNVSFGPCGLSNLRFGAALELVAVPEFALGVRVHVGEKMAPFTLVIFILGGGGWFDARTRYFPLSGRVTAAVSIGLSAGAMLAIEFGPVKGSIFAFFFVEAELQTDSADPGTKLSIAVGLLLGGEVDVLGLISVSIKLLLQLQYNTSDRTLTGTGTLSIKIKICWFLTINVSVKVEKKFATIGGRNAPGAALALTAAENVFGTVEDAVGSYLGMLE